MGRSILQTDGGRIAVTLRELLHFQGRQLCHFPFLPFLSMGFNSYRKEFFPLRVDPILEGFFWPGKQIKSHYSCLSWKKIRKQRRVHLPLFNPGKNVWTVHIGDHILTCY